MAYTGLPPKLKEAIFRRDKYRCRWCGATNQPPYDVHHIRYRRGYADDVPDNLVTLCRRHHDFVHDSWRIPKLVAQDVLRQLVLPDGMGVTGAALLRQRATLGTERVPGGNGRLLVLTPAECGCPHPRARHHHGRCLAPDCECGG